MSNLIIVRLGDDQENGLNTPSAAAGDNDDGDEDALPSFQRRSGSERLDDTAEPEVMPKK